MAPPLLFTLSELNLEQVQFDAAAIEAINPHRGAMRMLDGIIWARQDFHEAVAFKDIRDDEFWVPGHIPGRPIFPGVLQIEAAAQLASFCTIKQQNVQFMGFVGLDEAKFRGQVVPGDRLHILTQLIELRTRRSICRSQGLVNGNLVFEAKITGMPM